MNDKPITDQKLDELQALCEAATPGPWITHLVDDTTVVVPNGIDVCSTCLESEVERDDSYNIHYERMEADAAFIAGLNPQTALSLIKRVRELEGAVTSQNRAIAEFLDAETAWNNDEINEAEYVDTLSALKPAMYEARRILKGEQP